MRKTRIVKNNAFKKRDAFEDDGLGKKEEEGQLIEGSSNVQAAPATERPIAKPVPVAAHTNG